MTTPAYSGTQNHVTGAGVEEQAFTEAARYSIAIRKSHKYLTLGEMVILALDTIRVDSQGRSMSLQKNLGASQFLRRRAAVSKVS